jgi:hypothetical protein
VHVHKHKSPSVTGQRGQEACPADDDDEGRAAIRRAGAEDARRSRVRQGLPERIEDPAAVAVLAAILRDTPAAPRARARDPPTRMMPGRARGAARQAAEAFDHDSSLPLTAHLTLMK